MGPLHLLTYVKQLQDDGVSLNTIKELLLTHINAESERWSKREGVA